MLRSSTFAVVVLSAALIGFSILGFAHCNFWTGGWFCSAYRYVDDWQTMLGAVIAVAGGALAVFAVHQQIMQTERLEKQSLERERRASKLHLLSDLGEYQAQCEKAFWETQAAWPDGHAGAFHNRVPVPPEFYRDKGLTVALDEEIAKEMFDLDLRVREANRYFEGLEDAGLNDEGEVPRDVMAEAALLSREVWAIREKLASSLGIPLKDRSDPALAQAAAQAGAARVARSGASTD